MRLGDGPDDARFVEFGTECRHRARGVCRGAIGGGIVQRPAGSGILLGGELGCEGEERESAESKADGQMVLRCDGAFAEVQPACELSGGGIVHQFE